MATNNKKGMIKGLITYQSYINSNNKCIVADIVHDKEGGICVLNIAIRIYGGIQLSCTLYIGSNIVYVNNIGDVSKMLSFYYIIDGKEMALKIISSGDTPIVITSIGVNTYVTSISTSENMDVAGYSKASLAS